MDWILTLILAWMFAELMSGLFHWLEDRYGNPAWPVIGPLVVQPNLEHHIRPAKLCQGSYWDRNCTTIIPSAILASAFYWCPPVCLGFIILSQANEIHSWAHQRCNPLIRFIQRTGILQSPKHHSIHHKRPFDRYYCVFTNYMNPVLRVVCFWELVEFLIWAVSGISPRPERAEA